MKVWSGLLLLCLLSVCRAAPLTCDQLLTNEYHVQDLSGRWYLHAMSIDSCVISNLMYTFIKPSVAMDISLKETPKQCEMKATFKFLSFCMNETETYLYEEGSLTRHNQNVKLLASSSTDSFVMKADSTVNAMYLLSRKTTIDAADLRQFETLATCVSVPRPQQLGSDYDFDTCKDIEQTEPSEAELTIMKERAETLVAELAKCFWNWIQSYTG